jgi:sarcosine oxidase subunit beta
VSGATPLPAQADVVVIGGGIMGLSIAHALAQEGQRSVVVLEKSYLVSGASGRNGGGVRAQWSSEDFVELMKDSIRICRDFAKEMRINVWFRQGGYLFLARSDAHAEQLAKSVEMQRRHGLSTRLVDRREAKRVAPILDTTGIVAGSYNAEDGVVFPWPFVWGYAHACAELGVGVHTFTEVLDLVVEAGRVVAVETNRGRVRCERVVVAAGAWSPEVAAMAGVALPNKPHRHEICASEPLKPFLEPLVAELESGLYFSQSMRGEIVGGVSNARVPEGLDQGSGPRFLGLYARALTRAAPRLGSLRVLRQWAGCYDITPDGSPVVGAVDEVEGLTLACGFMGHGFMMAPVFGPLFARHLLRGEEAELFHRWNLRRFATGELAEAGMTLG